MGPFGKDPLGDALRAATTFDEAVTALIAIYRYEQSIWHPDFGGPSFWQDAIDQAVLASTIHKGTADPVATMRANDLDMFADALESGDWHSLAF